MNEEEDEEDEQGMNEEEDEEEDEQGMNEEEDEEDEQGMNEEEHNEEDEDEEEEQDTFLYFSRIGDLSYIKSSPVDINYTDHRGNTALHYACANGHLDIVQYLQSQSCDTIQNESGNTAIHWACLNGHLEIVKLFKKDTFLVKNKAGQTPGDVAEQAKHWDICVYITECLLGEGDEENDNDIDIDQN